MDDGRVLRDGQSPTGTPRPEAQVGVLEEEEVAFVEAADLAEECPPHQEARPDKVIARPGRPG